MFGHVLSPREVYVSVLRLSTSWGKGQAATLTKLWAHYSYRGLVDWVKDEYALDLESVTKEPGQRGFAVQPCRWVVERTIAWLCRNRRLSKDYEYHTECSEAFLYLASIHLWTQCLASVA